MANVANMRQMRLIGETIRRPPKGVIMAERNEAGDFSLYHPSNRQLLKDSQLLYINEENIFKWDIFIDIRSFIYDENIPGFNDQFAFGGTTFPRTSGFNLYHETSEVTDFVISGGMMRDRQQYLDTFHAGLQLPNGDVVYWLNTTPRPVQDFFEQRDLEIYHRMMPDSEFFEPGANLEARTPYRTEDLYPFGYVSARITFHPDPHRPPEITFINRIYHPNIFPDGMVDPRVYRMGAEMWRYAENVKDMLDSILDILRAIIRILKEPDLNYRMDVVAAVQRLINHIRRENVVAAVQWLDINIHREDFVAAVQRLINNIHRENVVAAVQRLINNIHRENVVTVVQWLDINIHREDIKRDILFNKLMLVIINI